MAKRHKFDFDLRVANFEDLRAMKAGESRVFAIGSSLTLFGSVTSKISGKFAQKVMLLIDPMTAKVHRVLVGHCIEPSEPLAPKSRGRKRKDKAVIKPLARTCVPGDHVSWKTIGGTRHTGILVEWDSNVAVIDCNTTNGEFHESVRKSVEV